MMSHIVVQDDVIVNVVVASDEFAAEMGWLPNQGWAIGWVRDGDTFVAPGIE